MSQDDQTPDADAPADETPVQRALRLKKAALDARPQAPRGGRFQREQNARIAAGKSRPWMSK
ncbi:hypothetical protein GCM10017620_04440 [Brevundimonas intermedia]|jgi:hypothetical protein|uniref:Uncharacterized protein n=1 Tax=Brevundimonas intermedia TaxID=74315 RepID=A0ABQ5T6R4_9CAUL|nr:hypothetical protein [Brevundimonas intermedia]GLK47471.1 hypothetical protein GCM10017620_04440 [Brevundimonas intermedia]